MTEDLRLRDYRTHTQEAYLDAVRKFLNHVREDPDALGEEDLRHYVLHLRDERKLSASYRNIAVCGLRFFFQHCLGRDWEVFDLLRVQRPRTLPVVLSTSEVRTLLGAVRHPVRRMVLTSIYALGLRIGEGRRLQTEHIDSDRLLVWVRDGKGAKDRTVPLPRPLLVRLRRYWRDERPASMTTYLFVRDDVDQPFEETTLQKTLAAALRDAGLAKHATPHTLRHSYATHLIESGVSLRTVQAILGHASLRATEVYLHVTTASAEHVQRAVDRLMFGLVDFEAATLAERSTPNTPLPSPKPVHRS
jgi:site-specific recombinase XerD